jgi:prepilin-type N-terminal cleavage/methylation domain-containing protein
MKTISAKMIRMQPNATRAADRAACHSSPATEQSRADLPPLDYQRSTINSVRGFTLIELLVVISIIGVIASFTFGAMGSINRNKKISTARGELVQIETALENYKAKYGVYPPANQNVNSIYLNDGNANDRSQFSQLFYELSGTTQTIVNGVNAFSTLDGAYSIPVANVQTAYGVGGFINCSKGGGEDVQAAKNFLPSLSSKMVYDHNTNNGVSTTALVTSVGGSDATYQPLSAVDLNPIRYVYPGTNNPSSYDLWVQLQINGKKYLVSNWSKAAQVNMPLP